VNLEQRRRFTTLGLREAGIEGKTEVETRSENEQEERGRRHKVAFACLQKKPNPGQPGDGKPRIPKDQ
jgi:hypothetical protein